MPSNAPTPDRPIALGESIEVAVAVVFRRTKNNQHDILTALRNVDATRGNLWEFPGGKVEANESIVHAARREAREEVGVELVGGTYFCSVRDEDPSQPREQVVVLHAVAFDVTAEEITPEARASQQVRWIGLDEAGALQWPRANEGIFDAFKIWLSQNG